MRIILPKEGARGKDGELTGAPPSGIAKGIPCMPIVVVPWQNAHNETRLTLAEIPSITTKSFLVCMYGGIIKPLNSGQKKKENKTVVEQVKNSSDETDGVGLGAILAIQAGANIFEKGKKYLKFKERVENVNLEQWKKDFVLEMFPVVFKYANEGNIPVEIMFAQMCLESAYGENSVTTAANNYFGIKGLGPAGSYSTLTDEHIDGKDIKIKDDFRAYFKMEESMEDYINLLNEKYRQHLEEDTIDGWADALVKGGYATAPNYKESILNILDYWRLQ